MQLRDSRDQGRSWQLSSRLGLELVQLYFYLIPLVKAVTYHSIFQGREKHTVSWLEEGNTLCLVWRNVKECVAIFIYYIEWVQWQKWYWAVKKKGGELELIVYSAYLWAKSGHLLSSLTNPDFFLSCPHNRLYFFLILDSIMFYLRLLA